MERLKEIKKALSESAFFQNHELIGSSLLFVHDAKGKVGVWLIDFGKTVPLTNGTVIDHKSPWSLGNHEDGYLIGLENIMNIFQDLDQNQKSRKSWKKCVILIKKIVTEEEEDEDTTEKNSFWEGLSMVFSWIWWITITSPHIRCHTKCFNRTHTHTIHTPLEICLKHKICP